MIVTAYLQLKENTLKLNKMKIHSSLFLSTTFLIVLVVFGCQTDNKETDQSQNYDLVISNARVIDPETGLDSVLNIGVNGGTIEKLTGESIKGTKEIDANNKIASPGFIDLHTHSPFPYGESFQVRDGATTILDLEAGAFPSTEYGHFIKDSARANYGASTAHALARMKVIEGKDESYFVAKSGEAIVPGATFAQLASADQVEEMRQLLRTDLDNGGLGIGLLLDYMSPAVSDEELRMIFEVAKEKEVVVWAHIRRGINGDITGLNDVLDLSQEIGTSLHICHINANSMGEIENWLKAIDEANAKGADISVELFPYTAGSTSISADVFSRDWQTIFDITYEDVQWSETGEWFTKESWEDKRKNRPEGMIIHHYMKEEWIQKGLKYPAMMVSSDATPAVVEEVKANPNLAGTYTRLLAKYVRDEKILTLQDAIAKGSYYPAKRLESFAPVFKKKGRIQEGADADILVYDLNKLQDHATYTDPYQASTGWSYVIVNGEIVVENDELTTNRPGKRQTAK